MNDFDRFVDSYEQEIAGALPLSGPDPGFFLELKAELIVGLVRRRWGDPARARVLDVGCGPGTMDAYLVGRVGSVHGVDTSSAMVQHAALRNRTVVYAVCEPDRLPFEPASFDVAFASCVLHHVDLQDRRMFARELQRVVAPGGLVVVLEHNPFNPLTRRAVSNCAFDEGVRLVSMRESTRLLDDAQATVLERRYIVFLPWRGRHLRRIEAGLARVPLGAQYLVAGRSG
jgi:SAM-dependent methyltransferase